MISDLYDQVAAAATTAAATAEPSAAEALTDVADAIRDRRFPVGPPNRRGLFPPPQADLSGLFAVRVATAMHRRDAAAAYELASVARKFGLTPGL